MKILYIDSFSGFSSSMLLGALLDMGASENYIKDRLGDMGISVSIDKTEVSRQGMECVLAEVKSESDLPPICEMDNTLCEIWQSCTTATNDEICTWAAVICAIESFEADYIICSNLKEGANPSKDALNILSQNGFCVNFVDEEITLITCEGASLLVKMANENNSCPEGELLCAGYGAGKTDTKNIVNLVRTALVATGDNLEFLSVFEEMKI